MILKFIHYCPYCKEFITSKESPPPLVKKFMIKEGVDTWIATKPCLNCGKEK